MLRLLVVDDSPTSRAIAARILGPFYELKTAGGGPEALALVAGGGIDLVLLDLLMPGMDGQAVLRQIRAADASLPVLIMTADVQDSTRARLLGLGATEVINKPLTTEKLMGAVARALADAAGGRP